MTSDGTGPQGQRTSEGASHRPYVEARRLTKVYRTPAGEFTALKGLDLQVQRGDFVAVIGKR